MTALKTMLGPFDPGDDFDAMGESFRRQVSDIMLSALDAAVFREMPVHRQLECFMTGVTTGLVGVCLSHVSPEGRDAMMTAIAEYLPHARLNAEGILDEAQP